MECPKCESIENVTTNKLFGPQNTARYYCENCGTFFG